MSFMTRSPRRARSTRTWALAALIAAPWFASAAAPNAALAKPSAKKATSTSSASKPVKGATDAGDAAANSASPARALLHSIRAEMVAASRESRPSDLPALLLSSTVESGFTMMLHSVYAVGATGQALRSGGVSGKDAAIVAKDVGHNLAGVALTWVAMAKHPAFAGVGAEAMTMLTKAAGNGVTAARALQSWAETPDAGTRAGAFEQAHEAWRSSVSDLARALRGPEADAGKPEAEPPPSPPAP